MTPAGLSLDRIGQISIIVTDVERATVFYRDVLGMKFLFQFPGMAFFDCGGVRLYLARRDTPEQIGTSVLYYKVESIRGAWEELKARGVHFLQEPHLVHRDERHELWLAAFKDSEGNLADLMSEVPIQA